MPSDHLHKKPAKRTHRPRTQKNAKTFARAKDATRATSSTKRQPKPRPTISYPPNLPVSAQREAIMEAIANNQVVVVSGETGSGKTTQLPKMCVDLGRGTRAMIGHTQPRRLAARSVAARIAEELNTPVGQAVGFQIRFTDKVSDSTLIKLMTDGILLAEIQHDPMLRAYDTIIVDEAHERSLNIDFIVGYLARLLPKRPDLKLIITSATIDAQRFADHFAAHLGVPVPTIDVSGRTYPVEVRYRPLDDANDVEDGICMAVDELMAEGEGDILVFLPGERDIREAELALADHLRPPGMSPDPRNLPVEIVPLFARLSPADQNRIFQPHQRRRIVLSTNIAETSLTVPGIRFVIDSGLARISRYSSRTKVQRLPIEPVSQASANQRSGRCGRIEAGIAIRLFDEDDYMARPAFTEPEILRTSLASVILSMASLKLGAVEDFPFIDPPSHAAIANGIQLLIEIGAVTMSRPRAGHKAQGAPGREAPGRNAAEKNAPDRNAAGSPDAGAGATGRPYPKLTQIGRMLARLPIDPRLGRMLLQADRLGCLSEVLVAVAALSMQDIRVRPLDKEAEADAFHRRFTDKTSDFATYVHLWRYIRTQHHRLSRRAFRAMCHEEYLHYLRILEWQDVVGQLRDMLADIGLKAHSLSRPSSTSISANRKEGDAANLDAVRACQAELTGPHGTNVDDISQAMLAGLLSNIGVWNPLKNTYDGARHQPFALWPGSGLARLRKPHEWVMAAELVETSRTFARNVAAIDPSWILPLAKHLVKYSYSGIFWSASRGAAMVTQKATLYGLVILERDIALASLKDHLCEGELADPAISHLRYGPSSAHDLSRAMFIRRALLEGQWRAAPGFQRRNAQLFERIEQLEHRTRTSGLRADDDALVAFFDGRVDLSVTNAMTFFAWWKTVRADNPRLLDIPEDIALYDGALRDGKLGAASGAENGGPGAGASVLAYSTSSRRGEEGEGGAKGDPCREVGGLKNPVSGRADHGGGLLSARAGAAFPMFLDVDGQRISLSYVFKPGAADDGITATISVAQLQSMRPEAFSWLVPGLRLELIEQTIRSLPKPIRRQLVPAPAVAKRIGQVFDGTASATGAATGSATGAAAGSATGPATGAAPASNTPPPATASGSPAPSARQPVGEMSLEDSLAKLAGWAQAEGKLSAKRSSKKQQRPPATKNSAPGTAAADAPQDQKAESTAVRSWLSMPFDQAFSMAVAQVCGVTVDAGEVRRCMRSLPDHLRITFRLVDERGRQIASSKHLGDLQRAHQHTLQKTVAAAALGTRNGAGNAHLPQHLLTTAFSSWPVEDLPVIEQVIDARKEGVAVFPSLAVVSDDGDDTRHAPPSPSSPDPLYARATANSLLASSLPAKLILKAHRNALLQQNSQRAAVASLLATRLRLSDKRIVTRLDYESRMMAASLPYASTTALVDACHVAAAAWIADAVLADPGARRFILDGPTPAVPVWNPPPGTLAPVWDSGPAGRLMAADAFERLHDAARQLMEDTVNRVLVAAVECASCVAGVSEMMDGAGFSSAAVADSVDDVRQHMAALVYPGFIERTPAPALLRLPVYLAADGRRLPRAAAHPDRDGDALETVDEASSLVARAIDVAANAVVRPDGEAGSRARGRFDRLVEASWLVEELRVSLFAQELGTAQKVSLQRIRAFVTG